MTGLSLGNGIERFRTFDADYRIATMLDGVVLDRSYAWDGVAHKITVARKITVITFAKLFVIFPNYDAFDRRDVINDICFPSANQKSPSRCNSTGPGFCLSGRFYPGISSSLI